jgi:uncharacterized protein (TIGR00299 family) protein
VSVDVSPHRRRLADILELLEAADLNDAVRRRSAQVFHALGEAEARVHGHPIEAVHFHEVGALDSLADVVGVVAAVDELALDLLVCSPIALGGGRIITEHGAIPIPGPAVLELLRRADAPGFGGPIDLELATPTGVALAVTLAKDFGPMPALRPGRVGTGAGGRDPDGHTNVTRLVLGETSDELHSMVVVEANVDDLDPRLWPPTLAALISAGAADAWLTQILMKKGRPAYTVSVLADPRDIDPLRRVLFTHTTTIGIRQYPVSRTTLDREERRILVAGNEIRMKLSRLDGRVVTATPEYEDVITAASLLGLPPKRVMDAARAEYAEHADEGE